MRRLILAGVLMSACTGSVATTTSAPAVTTSTANVPITSTTVELSVGRWFQQYLIPWADAYNTEFAIGFDEHMEDFELTEARLDCVEAQALLPGWKDSVVEAPDPRIDALRVELFDQLETALQTCASAETLGDYNDAGSQLEATVAIIERIQGRVNEIAEGLN